MKKDFKKIYSNLRYVSNRPEEYYGHLITLSGMVFNAETDEAIENDLKQLSLAYESLHSSTIGKVKEIVHEIVFWTKSERNNRLPDIDHLLHQHRNATLDEVNALLVNIAQLNNQGDVEAQPQQRIVADFTPLIRQLEELLKDLEPIKTQDVNLPKIIGWFTQKALRLGYLENEAESSEDDDQL